MGVFVTDEGGYTQYWNDQLCEITGMSVEEAQGTGWAQGVHPEDRERVFAEWYESDEKRASWRSDCRFIHRDGRTTWAIVQAARLHDQQGVTTGFVGTVTDITQRKRAEEALRVKDCAIASSVTAIVFADLDDRITYANRAFLTMWGYEREEEILGRPSLELAASAERAREILERVRTDGSWVGEDIARKKDGSLFPVLLVVETVKDPGGSAIGSTASIMDMSERKRGEKALHESEARHRHLFDRMPIGLYQTTPDGRILAANPELARMLGFAESTSLLEKNVHSLYAESTDREQLLREINQRGVALDLEYQLKRHDGSRIWVRENARAIRDDNGDVLHYEGSLEDITEQRQAEDALRSEMEFSASLLQASPTFFAAISADGTTLMMNEAMLTALGYTHEEAAGTNYLDTFVPEADREMLAGIFNKLVHSKESTFNENHVLTKDGRELLVEWRGRPVFKKDGEFDFFFGVGIDITERRQAEEKRARMQAQLSNAHKLQAVGQLAAGVAHDFNSLLTVILGNVELLERQAKREAEDAPPVDASTLDQIHNAVDRGRVLVQKLLVFGRAQKGRPQRVQPNRLIMDTQAMLQPMLSKKVETRTNLAADLKCIRVDAGQLEQAVMNLVLNARDAMSDGGTLSIETANVTLDHDYVTVHPDAVTGDYVMVAVGDTGTGMIEETRQRLFEPFYSTKAVDEGAGLGLSIVHGIVTQAGGHIDVDSEPGKGAVFRMYFPAVG